MATKKTHESKDIARTEAQGTKIIIPEGMVIDDAIKALQNQKKEEDTVISVREPIEAYPLEGAYAFMKALAHRYGWVDMRQPSGFFGPEPTQMIGVNVSLTEVAQVVLSKVMIPGIEGWVCPYFEMKEGRFESVIVGQIKKKNLKDFQELCRLTREIVKSESIYKGKALRISFPENPREFSPVYQPKFLDVSKADAASLIFSESVRRQVQTNLFTPIEYTERCREAGIPLKRGVLLEGPYGTGKTLTAYAAANLCEKHGWTFIYLESVKSLSQAILFAKQYEPAMIFAEDIDRVMEGDDRDHEMDAILNTIDGIESKDSEIIVVLTTNHVDRINQAMLRPGRLDAVISVKAPDAEAVVKLMHQYGRGLIRLNEDLSESAAKLAGQIPAVIREVVERAKLSAMSRSATIILTDEDLSEAADGMLNHLSLLQPKVADTRSDIEKAADKLGGHLVKMVAMVDQPEPSSAVLTTKVHSFNEREEID